MAFTCGGCGLTFKTQILIVFLSGLSSGFFTLSMPGMHAAGEFVSALAVKSIRLTSTLPRTLVAVSSRAMYSGIPQRMIPRTPLSRSTVVMAFWASITS